MLCPQPRVIRACAYIGISVMFNIPCFQPGKVFIEAFIVVFPVTLSQRHPKTKTEDRTDFCPEDRLGTAVWMSN